MLTRQALSYLVKDARSSLVLRRAHRIFEILRPGQTAMAFPNVILVESFPSVADLEAAIKNGVLVPGIGAVMYDIESWTSTPLSEKLDPAGSFARARSLVKAQGLTFIAAPALDLVSTLRPKSSAQVWRDFLSLGITRVAARNADLVVLQAQSLERIPAIYAQFVAEASSQARLENPSVELLAGLSSNPPGTSVSPGMLASSIALTRRFVSGYWINIPGQGPQCPSCNPQRPEVAIDALVS